jgi:hypothetical protein
MRCVILSHLRGLPISRTLHSARRIRCGTPDDGNKCTLLPTCRGSRASSIHTITRLHLNTTVTCLQISMPSRKYRSKLLFIEFGIKNIRACTTWEDGF